MTVDPNLCSIFFRSVWTNPSSILNSSLSNVFHTVSICAQIVKFQIFGLSAQQLEELVIEAQ